MVPQIHIWKEKTVRCRLNDLNGDSIHRSEDGSPDLMPTKYFCQAALKQVHFQAAPEMNGDLLVVNGNVIHHLRVRPYLLLGERQWDCFGWRTARNCWPHIQRRLDW